MKGGSVLVLGLWSLLTIFHVPDAFAQPAPPVIVWGDNTYGQTNVPSAASNAVAVAAGYYHNLALKRDGTVVAWGNNDFGQATPPSGLTNVVAIAAGDFFSLALRKDGTVVGWGRNDYGQRIPPAGLCNVVAVAAGGNHSLALRSDGLIVGWGYAWPATPPVWSNYVAIAAGWDSSLALEADGTLNGWAGAIYPSVPLTNALAVVIGKEYLALAVKRDGTVAGWGNNIYGEATPPDGVSNAVAIAAGAFHSLILTADGFVIAWGLNDHGQTNVPALPSKAVGIAAGYDHSVALLDQPGAGTAPAVFVQPANRTVAAGSMVPFNVGVCGSEPLRFQWFFEDAPIAGETNRWYGIPSIQPEQAGNYHVVVTNDYGSVTSAVAVVFESPGIVTQPTNQEVLLGSNATFSVSVLGPGPIHYQWQCSGNEWLWVDVNGGNASTLIVSNVQKSWSGDRFRVVMTNDYGVAISDSATLTVLTPPVITQQPYDQTNAVGKDASVFWVSASGTEPIHFQWYFNNAPLTNTPRKYGIYQSTYSWIGITNVQPEDAGPYYLVATNLYGVATSSVANLAVVVPPSIVQQPVDQTALVGSTVDFSVVADGTEPLVYRWRRDGIKMMDGGRISGRTTASLRITNVGLTNAADYSVVITNSAGSITSAVATLTVHGVEITGQPTDRTVCLDSNVTFTVIASGETNLYYQWYFNGAPLADGERVGGSATETLSLWGIRSSDAGRYYAVVTNSWMSNTSRLASLTVQANSPSSVLYVCQSSTNPVPPYLNWETAATNIQDAVDSAIGGNLVVVSNGVYVSGGAVVRGVETNRVALTKAITVRSLNGPETTTIAGSAGTRGAYIGTNAVLSGFTITNGQANAGVDAITERSGGGVWCESSGTVTNCVIGRNLASNVGGTGGGVYGGIVRNCIITGNSAPNGAGVYRSRVFHSIISSNSISGGVRQLGVGAWQCVLSNCVVVGNMGSSAVWGGGTASGTNACCVLVGNSAGAGGGSYDDANFNCLIVSNTVSAYNDGGGVRDGSHYNCTIAYNSAGVSGYGGGAYGGALYNSIIYSNWASTGPNYVGSLLTYCCTVPGGVVTADPLFVNPAAGDFRLQPGSPCRDAGSNTYVHGSTDLDGRPRITGARVDIGVYEFQGTGMNEFIAWLNQFDLPADGSADYLDSDGDGLNNRQEWRAGTNPTNASSVLILLSPQFSGDPSGVVVTWQSVNGITYFLQRNSSLTGPFNSIQSNIVGAADTTTVTDTTATNSEAYFYRVGIQ